MPRQHVGSVRRVRSSWADLGVVRSSTVFVVHHVQNDEGEKERGADGTEEGSSGLQ